jgi:hypothetical protein
MKKLLVTICVTVVLLVLSTQVMSQMYILNEDFSSATANQPPSGWSNSTIIGNASYDQWRFDNPGNRTYSYPAIGKVAIFDSENYSQQGGVEKVSLETPFLDCSFSSSILLSFHHQFVGGLNGLATVEVFNGLVWSNLITFSDSTSGVELQTMNASAWMGGKTNAKLRFTWQGDASYFWLVDNVKVFAPLSRDANLKSLDSPVMPISAGVHPVSVTLLNEGLQSLTSATIKWKVNNVQQPNNTWSGT